MPIPTKDYHDQMCTNVAVNVRRYRISRGYSQQQLAILMGMKRNSIQEVEKGKRKPAFRLLCKLAQALDVEIGLLFAPVSSTIDSSLKTRVYGHCVKRLNMEDRRTFYELSEQVAPFE